jgi:hypothetical protein
MAAELLAMLEGGPEQPVMQCHCSRDDAPEVCVGFALQVGTRSVKLRIAVLEGWIDVDGFEADEPLHTLLSLLQQHGGRRESSDGGRGGP